MGRLTAARLIAIMILAAAPALTVAQDLSAPEDTNTPFSWIAVGIGGHAVPLSRGLDAWNAGPAASLLAQTPFFVGRAVIGAQGQQWTSTQTDVPDFRGVFLFAGLRGGTSSAEQVRLSAGLRLGNYFMAFDSDEISGNRNESELAIAPDVEIRIRLTRTLDLRLESSTMRVFTLPHLTLFSVGAGISVRFNAPDGLRRFME